MNSSIARSYSSMSAPRGPLSYLILSFVNLSLFLCQLIACFLSTKLSREGDKSTAGFFHVSFHPQKLSLPDLEDHPFWFRGKSSFIVGNFFPIYRNPTTVDQSSCFTLTWREFEFNHEIGQ